MNAMSCSSMHTLYQMNFFYKCMPQQLIFFFLAGLTTLLYVLPLTLSDNFLPQRTPDTFFQLIHPAWILLLTSSSHLQSLLTVDPGPCSFNSSPSYTHSLHILNLALAQFEASSLQCISPNLQIIL